MMRYIIIFLILVMIPMVMADNYTIEQSMTALTAGELSNNYTGRFSGAIHQPLAKVSDLYTGMLGILYDDSINPTTIKVEQTSICGSQVCFDITLNNTGAEISYPKTYYWTGSVASTAYSNSYGKGELPVFQFDVGETRVISNCVFFNSTDNYIRVRTVYDIYSNLNLTPINKNGTCIPQTITGGAGGSGGMFVSSEEDCGLTLYTQKMSFKNRAIRYVVVDKNEVNVQTKFQESLLYSGNGDYVKSILPLMFTTNLEVTARNNQCQTVLKLPVDKKSVIFSYLIVLILICGTVFVLTRKRK